METIAQMGTRPSQTLLLASVPISLAMLAMLVFREICKWESILEQQGSQAGLSSWKSPTIPEKIFKHPLVLIEPNQKNSMASIC
ncbi:hypothetical protein PG987_007796 [Apiospora arundinis]|uniref:Uncharacterized protein n=1 Tax=Apiospora arundinis TaxID=335852 RepID=A0ABR2I467_9PEZI